MKQKLTQFERYKQKKDKLEEDILKGEKLIKETTESVAQKKKEVENLELLMAREILIENKMSVTDLAELLNSENR
ncbi:MULTISPECIES: hypothetical protein [Bacteria]|uniref:hypothetical protein n=1 Tax=Bacteria TaxID=2 RepID=UPI00066B1BB5|nr:MULTISPECIES: hypothetical protein [unclassified Granulicatella]